MKIFQRAIFGLAALAVSVVALPADAAGPVTVGIGGATATFFPLDERLVVKDTADDDRAAVAQYYWGSVKPADPPELWAPGGKGATAERNFDKPEAATIHFRVCRGIWSTKQIGVCSSWVTTTAGAYAPDGEPVASR